MSRSALLGAARPFFSWSSQAGMEHDSGLCQQPAGPGSVLGARPAPAASPTPTRHHRGTPASLPACPLSHSARDLWRVTPHKTPSPASLAGATASPRGAGVAGCRYPGTGLPQNRVLLPSWAELARAASQEPRWHPHSGGAVALRLAAQSLVGSWRSGPGGAEAQLPSQSRLPPWKAPGAHRRCRSRARGAGRSQRRLGRSLAVPVAPGAQRLTCTLMRAVAAARSPDPPRSAAWISSVYSGTACGKRPCHPKVGDELGEG